MEIKKHKFNDFPVNISKLSKKRKKKKLKSFNINALQILYQTQRKSSQTCQIIIMVKHTFIITLLRLLHEKIK
jgi:hypothetical protein